MPTRPLTALLLATLLAYLNALAAGFQFDDFNVIVDNPAVHSLAAWWAGMPGIRPLLKLSYTLNWLADPRPAGFHAVNVLLHLTNVALVWRLTRHMPLPAGWRDGPLELRARILATLLFALHPIQTEAVTYVSGRSMSLMASFGLAGLVCWLEAPGRPRRGLWLGAAGLLFAAAILTKEVAVVLPLALLLFGRPPGKTVLLAAVGLALAALFLLFGYQAFLAGPMPRTLFENLLSETNAVYYLLGQVFRPHALNIDPLLPELTGWTLASAAQLSGLIAAAALAWLFRRDLPWLAFAVFWFFLLLLPTYSLIPRLDLASERHLYLAGLGIWWLLAIALAGLLRRGLLPWLAAVPLALAGILATHLRNLDYRDEVSLWRQTSALDSRNQRAWHNLGWAYYLAGDRESARIAYQLALEIEPDDELTRNNLELLDRPTAPPAAAPTSAGTP